MSDPFKIPEVSCDFAANWWGERLRGELVPSGRSVSDAQVETFRGALHCLLRLAHEHCRTDPATDPCHVIGRGMGSQFACYIIDVDYDPAPALVHALDAACISVHRAAFSASGLFPAKTIMWIYEDRLEVKCGYRAPVETVFQISTPGDRG